MNNGTMFAASGDTSGDRRSSEPLALHPRRGRRGGKAAARVEGDRGDQQGAPRPRRAGSGWRRCAGRGACAPERRHERVQRAVRVRSVVAPKDPHQPRSTHRRVETHQEPGPEVLPPEAATRKTGSRPWRCSSDGCATSASGRSTASGDGAASRCSPASAAGARHPEGLVRTPSPSHGGYRRAWRARGRGCRRARRSALLVRGSTTP